MPAGRHVEPAEDVEQRRLAAARRPEQHDELAAVEIQVDRAQRVHLDLAHAVDLLDPTGLEDGLRRPSRAHRPGSSAGGIRGRNLR